MLSFQDHRFQKEQIGWWQYHFVKKLWIPNNAAAPIVYLQVTWRKRKATRGTMLRDNAQATEPELMTKPLSSVGKSSRPKVGKMIPGPWKKPRKYFAWIFIFHMSIMKCCQPIFSTHDSTLLINLSKILAYIDVFSEVLRFCTIWRGQKILFV